MSGSALSPNPPPWLALALVCALATAAACYPAWPGYMSYDSLTAYEQALYGVRTSLWPPLHTYLFMLSRGAGAGTWGLFLAQTFALLYGAGLILHLLTPRRPLAWLLCGLFGAGLVYFPTLLGAMLAHWRDVTTASFAILGIGLWLAAAQARSVPLLALAILSVSLSVGLRYNAIVLIGPVLALMIWRPFLVPAAAGGWTRATVLLLLVAGLGGAWASTQWRLPDGLRLPAAQNFGGTQEFDVIGVSACAGRNYLPAGITNGKPITVAQIRKAYDPRHLLSTLAPRPGVPAMVETDAGGRVASTWRRLLTEEPGCYLAHRSAVLVEQMGMARMRVFYPIHGAIDPNAFGLVLSHPEASVAVRDYVKVAANDLPRRPFWLYVAAALVGLVAVAAARRRALLILALLAGAFGYPALLFLAGPAADARYIFPSNALCLVIILGGLGLILGRFGARSS